MHSGDSQAAGPVGGHPAARYCFWPAGQRQCVHYCSCFRSALTGRQTLAGPLPCSLTSLQGPLCGPESHRLAAHCTSQLPSCEAHLMHQCPPASLAHQFTGLHAFQFNGLDNLRTQAGGQSEDANAHAVSDHHRLITAHTHQYTAPTSIEGIRQAAALIGTGANPSKPFCFLLHSVWETSKDACQCDQHEVHASSCSNQHIKSQLQLVSTATQAKGAALLMKAAHQAQDQIQSHLSCFVLLRRKPCYAALIDMFCFLFR